MFNVSNEGGSNAQNERENGYYWVCFDEATKDWRICKWHNGSWADAIDEVSIVGVGNDRIVPATEEPDYEKYQDYYYE